MHIFLTSALAEGEWSASPPCRFISGETASGTHWIGGWVGPRAGLNDAKRKFLTLPGLELRPLGLPAGSQSPYRLHYPGSSDTDEHNLMNIGILGAGIQGPLGTAATNRPIVPAPGDYDDGEIGGMIGRGNRSIRRKPTPVPLCPPQTPHAARTRTRAAAVGSQRLAA
jgi:hypothetical protein